MKLEDEKVEVDLSVLMSYGHTIPEMGKAVQEAVKTALESMTGLEVSAVNVNVGGITFPRPTEQAEDNKGPRSARDALRGPFLTGGRWKNRAGQSPGAVNCLDCPVVGAIT